MESNNKKTKKRKLRRTNLYFRVSVRQFGSVVAALAALIPAIGFPALFGYLTYYIYSGFPDVNKWIITLPVIIMDLLGLVPTFFMGAISIEELKNFKELMLLKKNMLKEYKKEDVNIEDLEYKYELTKKGLFDLGSLVD